VRFRMRPLVAELARALQAEAEGNVDEQFHSSLAAASSSSNRELAYARVAVASITARLAR